MDDKTLADKVAVLLGAERGQGPTSDRWFLHRESIEQYLGFNNKELVRDPRVAMALMERCLKDKQLHFDSCFVTDDSIPERSNRWEAAIETNLGASVALIWNESLPRAITEACVESLT